MPDSTRASAQPEPEFRGTPGPWKAVRVNDLHKGYGVIAVDPMRGRIDSRISGMSAANALLIAAAPELFEACCYMHRLLVDMGHGGLAGAILGDNAIAKALGGSR